MGARQSYFRASRFDRSRLQSVLTQSLQLHSAILPRARAVAGLLLWVYLCVLGLAAFGHHCAASPCHAAAGLSALADAPLAEHEEGPCSACVWLAAGAGTVPAAGRSALPGAESAALPSSLPLAPSRGYLPSPPSRAPPSA